MRISALAWRLVGVALIMMFGAAPTADAKPARPAAQIAELARQACQAITAEEAGSHEVAPRVGQILGETPENILISSPVAPFAMITMPINRSWQVRILLPERPRITLAELEQILGPTRSSENRKQLRPSWFDESQEHARKHERPRLANEPDSEPIDFPDVNGEHGQHCHVGATVLYGDSNPSKRAWIMNLVVSG
jgi:hypothetical protein